MNSTTRLADSEREPSLPVPVPVSASTSTTTAMAGTKRPAASLLPAFELSSSPGLPRPLKRQNTGGNGGHGAAVPFKYPTPMPTSTTGILSSSPLRRPALNRTTSERAPLSSLRSIDLPENGESITMGRSSNSSHVQLSANRLISRVHVRARYIPSTPSPNGFPAANKIEIVCEGWNGLKLHCQGRTEELFKGDSFTSSTEGTEIMLDVQDARIMIHWPKRSLVEPLSALSDSSWDDSPRSQRLGDSNVGLLQSSPLRRNTRIASPESPTPRNLASSQRLQALLPPLGVGLDQDSSRGRDGGIQIYEDEPSSPPLRVVDVNQSMRTEATASFRSELSDHEDDYDDEKDPDEENDPIVHSFGPFGANISGRMASMLAKSPIAAATARRIPPRSPIKRVIRGTSSTDTLTPRNITPVAMSPQRRTPLPAISTSADSPLSSAPSSASKSSPSPGSRIANVDPAVANHVINQLAFSRLSSTPLSTIMHNLPVDHRRDLTTETLRLVIEATPSIGTIERQGKDAAGKALESEYYYMPERDEDESRRAAVVDGLRKPSLRNCRKQHKVSLLSRAVTLGV